MDPVEPTSSRGTAIVPLWMRGSTNLLAMVVTAVLVGLLVVLIGWLSPVLAPLGLGMFMSAIAGPSSEALITAGVFLFRLYQWFLPIPDRKSVV